MELDGEKKRLEDRVEILTKEIRVLRDDSENTKYETNKIIDTKVREAED